MDKYFVESKHTPEECLRALDEILAKGPDALSKVEWGCMAGDHTGYSIVEATGPTEALKDVPTFLRPKARAVKLNKFTPEQIKSFHQKSA
ncbi:MAG: hypothetical protein ACM31I_10635 [Deltaproteobacteria bacterium]